MTTPSVPSIPELAERLREHAKRVYTDDLSFPVMTPRRLIIEAADALEELSRLKAETPDNGDRSGHDLPEALREFMADRGRLLAYGDADLIREAIAQLSRLKAGEQPTDKEADLRALGVAPAAPRERERIEELEQALKPFADTLVWDDTGRGAYERGDLTRLTYEDILRARAALAPSTSGGK